MDGEQRIHPPLIEVGVFCGIFDKSEIQITGGNIMKAAVKFKDGNLVFLEDVSEVCGGCDGLEIKCGTEVYVYDNADIKCFMVQ